MTVIAGNSGSFKRELPPVGWNNAVCVDEYLMQGVERKKYRSQDTEVVDRFVLVFAVGTPDGTRFYHQTVEDEATGQKRAGWVVTARKEYRPSLDEKANLSKHLESWFNKKLSAEQRKAGIDMSKLIGQPAMIQISHTPDGQYANIDAILPLAPGMVRLPVPPANEQGYTRVKDRPPKEAQGGGQAAPVQYPPATPPAPPPADPFGAPAPQPVAAAPAPGGYQPPPPESGMPF